VDKKQEDHENMKIGDTTTKCSPESIESPLVILRFKPWIICYCMIAVLMCSWLFSFGTIVPYLTTGDFNQIWPANIGNTGEKIVMFAIAWPFWLYFPTLIPVFATGNVYFFEKHIELRPYLPFIRKRIVYYDGLHIRIREGRGILLTNAIIPKWWKSPYTYWKIVSLNGFRIPFSSIGLKNPEVLPQAISIVREKATSVSTF
jgi:hypothetical protein